MKQKLIDADKLYCDFCNGFENSISDAEMDRFAWSVSNAPTVDAEPVVHAHWEPRCDVNGYENCSNCHDCNIWGEWANGKNSFGAYAGKISVEVMGNGTNPMYYTSDDKSDFMYFKKVLDFVQSRGEKIDFEHVEVSAKRVSKIVGCRYQK